MALGEADLVRPAGATGSLREAESRNGGDQGVPADGEGLELTAGSDPYQANEPTEKTAPPFRYLR